MKVSKSSWHYKFARKYTSYYYLDEMNSCRYITNLLRILLDKCCIVILATFGAILALSFLILSGSVLKDIPYTSSYVIDMVWYFQIPLFAVTGIVVVASSIVICVAIASIIMGTLWLIGKSIKWMCSMSSDIEFED